MRFLRLAATVIVCAGLVGFAAPTDTMPPNTIPFSHVLRELSSKPGFTDAFLKDIQGHTRKSGAALLTPDLVDHLRQLIASHDWEGLDQFPGWTMADITPTIGVIREVAADTESPATGEQVWKFLDLGPYSRDDSTEINLRGISPLPPFRSEDVITDLGDGLVRGDGPNVLAPEHSDSRRLADVLNRLSANGLDGVAPVSAFWNDGTHPTTPEGLIEALMLTGQTVTVTDSRYFANFGHLHYNGQDVMTPFFVNTQILIPDTNRPLLVPVSHAEYEWHIRGPLLNADVSFYFGIDGKAEFRTMDELDQAWVMKRDAHEYRATDAIEVTRLAGGMVRTYMRLHQAHPDTPFGGYFAFGVCQDVVAAIELKMTGKATLFPNTAEDRLFTDARDAEINSLIRQLPKDRSVQAPDIERVFASLPVADTEEDLAKVTIPGLGADLVAVHRAWMEGDVRRSESRLHHRIKLGAIALLCLGFVAGAVLWWRKRQRRPA